MGDGSESRGPCLLMRLLNKNFGVHDYALDNLCHSFDFVDIGACYGRNIKWIHPHPVSRSNRGRTVALDPRSQDRIVGSNQKTRALNCPFGGRSNPTQ